MTQELQALATCLRKLADLNQGMKCSQSFQLLTIALNQGSTMGEIAIESGMDPSSVTRNKNVFRGKKRHDGTGATVDEELIAVESNPKDERQKILKLTPAGNQFMDELTEIIRGCTKEGNTSDTWGTPIYNYSLSIDQTNTEHK